MMQTNLLIDLLKEVIETNRSGEYFAAFRYGVNHEGEENLAVDLYKQNTNLYHSVVKDNQQLVSAHKFFLETKKKTPKYKISYKDEYVDIDETIDNEAIASAKEFLFKQKYNINVEIKEIR